MKNRSIALKASSLAWHSFDLSAAAGAPRSYEPRPYVRHDGVSSVISYGDNGRIFELALENGQWNHYDLLTASSGDPVGGHSPSGYVRSDRVSAVVYLVDAEPGYDIHELALRDRHWEHNNLTAIAGAPRSSSVPRPQGYVRGDGVTAVVYQAGNHIHELALEGGTTWTHWDLTVAAGAPDGFDQHPLGDMKAYARSDGASAIVYRSRDGEIRQLRLRTDGTWSHSVMTNDAGDPKGDLFGLDAYVRADGINTVVYQGVDERIYELTLVPGEWELNDLTAITGAAPVKGTSLSAYNRSDGTATVVYEGPNSHIHELALEGGQNWTHWDLTEITGSEPGKSPFGYIRHDGVTSIVYYGRDPFGARELALVSK